MDASCKKSLLLTSYGGIIRIRLKGRSRLLPLSLSLQAPLFLFMRLLYPIIRNIAIQIRISAKKVLAVCL